MILKHDQFIAAMIEKKKIWVQYYSKPDSGVLDRVCAPMDYGPGGEYKDGLNRCWLWDYAGAGGSHTLGLVPQQIVDLQVLGEEFDPAQLNLGPEPAPGVLTANSAPASVVPGREASVPIL